MLVQGDGDGRRGFIPPDPDRGGEGDRGWGIGDLGLRGRERWPCRPERGVRLGRLASWAARPTGPRPSREGGVVFLLYFCFLFLVIFLYLSLCSFNFVLQNIYKST